jgi:hypothetical protein
MLYPKFIIFLPWALFFPIIDGYFLFYFIESKHPELFEGMLWEAYSLPWCMAILALCSFFSLWKIETRIEDTNCYLQLSLFHDSHPIPINWDGWNQTSGHHLQRNEARAPGNPSDLPVSAMPKSSAGMAECGHFNFINTTHCAFSAPQTRLLNATNICLG